MLHDVVHEGETPWTSLSHGGAWRAGLRRRERVLVDVPEHHAGISGKGRHGDGLTVGGSAAGARSGSLISASWNQLVEWLRRLETLRECVKTCQEDHLNHQIGWPFCIPALYGTVFNALA